MCFLPSALPAIVGEKFCKFIVFVRLLSFIFSRVDIYLMFTLLLFFISIKLVVVINVLYDRTMFGVLYGCPTAIRYPAFNRDNTVSLTFGVVANRLLQFYLSKKKMFNKKFIQTT